MKACKAAIKAGKKMYPKETKQLIKDFIQSPSNFTCPHGRPLCIKIDKNELEKCLTENNENQKILSI